VSDLIKIITQLGSSESIGWGLVVAIITSIVWVVGIGIRNRGQLDIAKQEAHVSLNAQGQELVLQMVEALKEEVQHLRVRNAEMTTYITHNELVDDWREWPKMASVRMYGAAAAILGTVAASPDLLLSLVMFMPQDSVWRWVLVAAVVTTMFIFPTLVRLWKQLDDDDAPASASEVVEDVSNVA
jgi:hypothetical protein